MARADEAPVRAASGAEGDGVTRDADRRGVLQPYLRQVLMVLLRRLSESRTPKFSRAFARIIFLFISKLINGPTEVYALFEGVQPGYGRWPAPLRHGDECVAAAAC